MYVYPPLVIHTLLTYNIFPGLVIHPDHDNDIEYWENEELYYMCIDSEFGVDASADRMKKYKCKIDKPKGKYNTPRLELNETWPICQTKTTTVKPRKELLSLMFMLETL